MSKAGKTLLGISVTDIHTNSTLLYIASGSAQTMMFNAPTTTHSLACCAYISIVRIDVGEKLSL
jgi:hypothetical protein